ncbi:pterin-4a-carbinolamine dehydratase [Xenococcus sp. PCC 7305]|uniref:4a-hydroxytetrahydrobiopterin dehydratase n=1 Tax=Xenococcus sp. PCC 7305 TaxID=102125 RepID=UPI0002ABC721|nr:4a-hydroxytetrahydrobiopterin dehydratase [Xenococcus sp. PCC 7305]ELS03015.1 pterin-4a-carbinolamine dehydratase [Xenococcus sp. PCC 7305]
MDQLQKETCIPCEGQVAPITAAEISELLPQLTGWNIVKENGIDHLQRNYKFPDFQSALTFTNLVGEAAEKAGHHPVLVTEWGKVTVIWWTHAINGLHRNDFVMAAKTDQAFLNAN